MRKGTRCGFHRGSKDEGRNEPFGGKIASGTFFAFSGLSLGVAVFTTARPTFIRPKLPDRLRVSFSPETNSS